jgi:TRAP transporter TAXI family solute receptor
LFALMLCLASGCAHRTAPQARQKLTVSVLPIQVPVFSSALRQAFSAELPADDIQFIERDRGMTVKALQTGEADLAFLLADTTYLAFVGELDGRPYDRLRGIAALDPYPIFLIASADSSIRTVYDLQQRRVSLGAPGSSTALTGEIVLDALGIRAMRSYQPYAESEMALNTGTLDAIFAIGIFPLDRYSAVLSHGARILPLSQSTIALLHRRHPFLRSLVIPGGILGGIPSKEPLLTIGLNRILACRSGLDEDTVYKVTKALFRSLPDLALIDPPLRQTNAEDSPATPIPLHEGAARYYREQTGL